MCRLHKAATSQCARPSRADHTSLPLQLRSIPALHLACEFRGCAAALRSYSAGCSSPHHNNRTIYTRAHRTSTIEGCCARDIRETDVVDLVHCYDHTMKLRKWSVSGARGSRDSKPPLDTHNVGSARTAPGARQS